MPGLSVTYFATGAARPARDRWLRALEAGRGDAPSRRVIHLDHPCCRVGSDTHEHYPIVVREDGPVFVALEGRVYAGPSRVPMDELTALAKGLMGGGDDGTAAIRSHVHQWEGEFLAIVYSKVDHRLWVFSDALGRLPLYVARGDRALAVSRDQRFQIEHQGIGAVDRVGLAQLLLFGFPLGRHTLIRGVEHVPAGQGFSADPGGVRALEGLGQPLDSGRKERAGLPADRNAAELGDLFTRACRVRADAGDSPLLALSGGLDSRAVGAFSLPIFAMLRGAYGAGRTYWSGDGGDKVLPDHRPRLAARADLARYLIESRPIWPAAMIERLIGIRQDELRASVEEEIGRYPEASADQRFVRFQFVERGARWIFEEEDCNRHYYWTVAPFYDRAFLRAALACPDDQKSGHRLYRRFLSHLHPTVNRIPDANLGIAMDSPRYGWSRRLREVGRRFPRLRRLLRKGVPASVLQPRPALMQAFLTRHVERSEPVRSCFSTQALPQVASSPGQGSDAALDDLVTATCACERIMGRPSTPSEFAGESFG